MNFPGDALVGETGTLDGIAPGAVLVDVRWTEAALAGLALARSRGVPGVVDAEPPATEAVLEAASHVAFSRSGLAAFTGMDDKEAALLAAALKCTGFGGGRAGPDRAAVEQLLEDRACPT